MGPLLFVVYTNDIDEQIVSKILKFADDTKMYHIVQSPKDIETLQSDLHTLVAWSKDWQMLFNTDKCKVLHFGFNLLLVCVSFTIIGQPRNSVLIRRV